MLWFLMSGDSKAFALRFGALAAWCGAIAFIPPFELLSAINAVTSAVMYHSMWRAIRFVQQGVQ